MVIFRNFEKSAYVPSKKYLQKTCKLKETTCVQYQGIKEGSKTETILNLQ